MDPESIMLSEGRKTEKGEYHRTSVPSVWHLRYDTNELIYGTETETQRADSWLPKGKEVGKVKIGRLGLADANCHVQTG